MRETLFKKSNKIERFTLLFDFIYIAIYIALFAVAFGALTYPMDAGEVDLDALEGYSVVYEFLGFNVATPQMNTIISILILFMVIAIPMFFINRKNLRNRTVYEIDSYTAGSKFTQGVINLFSLNPISFGLRIYNMFVLVKMVKGYNVGEFFKSIPGAVKNFFTKLFKKKEKDHDAEQSSDEYSLSIKRSIRRQTATKILRLVLLYLFLVIVAILIIIPFYWMVVTSLKDFTSASSVDPDFFIKISQMNWVNYKVVLNELEFGLYIRNTVIVALCSTLGTIITTVLSAYAFARIEFKGREFLFSLLIMTMMIPGELYIITNIITVGKHGFGWVGMPTGENNYFIAMIIPFVTSISYIFFLRQSFKQVPESLYKAARVDGCSDFKFLTRVMVPIASPTIFTITLLNVFGSWNAYIWPRIITGIGGQEGQQYWLISNALRDTSFVLDNGRAMYNLQIAASALVTVPLLIVFFMFRKYIMNGIGRSGTKG